MQDQQHPISRNTRRLLTALPHAALSRRSAAVSPRLVCVGLGFFLILHSNQMNPKQHSLTQVALHLTFVITLRLVALAMLRLEATQATRSIANVATRTVTKVGCSVT